MTPTGIEPVLPPWKGDVLTAWPWSLMIHMRLELMTSWLKVRCSTSWANGSKSWTYRIWTYECSSQSAVPYLLANVQCYLNILRLSMCRIAWNYLTNWYMLCKIISIAFCYLFMYKTCPMVLQHRLRMGLLLIICFLGIIISIERVF